MTRCSRTHHSGDPAGPSVPDELRVSASGEAMREVFADGSAIAHLSPAASDELADYLEWAEQDFLQRFGRPMGPEDPLFYDPTAPTPTPLDPAVITRDILVALEEAGIDRAYQYAFAVTGMLLTEENEPLFSDEELDLFDAALAAYDEGGDAVLAALRRP